MRSEMEVCRLAEVMSWQCGSQLLRCVSGQTGSLLLRGGWER